jgi:hypothetical protein
VNSKDNDVDWIIDKEFKGRNIKFINKIKEDIDKCLMTFKNTFVHKSYIYRKIKILYLHEKSIQINRNLK